MIVNCVWDPQEDSSSDLGDLHPELMRHVAVDVSERGDSALHYRQRKFYRWQAAHGAYSNSGDVQERWQMS